VILYSGWPLYTVLLTFGFPDLIQGDWCELSTRQALYISCNIKVCSHNHCCSGKLLSIKYFKCVSIFWPQLSGMQITFFLLHIALSSVAYLDLSYFSTLSHECMIFGNQKITEHKMCVWFSLWFLTKTMYIRLHVNTNYSCQDLIKREFSWQIFKNYSSIKLHENQSSGSRIVSQFCEYI
jgi:hypothetical protein